MKFNPVQFQHDESNKGKWAIAARGNKFFSNSVRDTKEEVLALCRERSAEWHLNQAEALIKELDTKIAMKVACTASGIVRDVSDRAVEEELISPEDSMGWTA